MIRQAVTIKNKLGLHARAASKLVSAASGFESDVWVERGHRRINGKSIMGVLTLAAGQGSELVIETSGEDECEAIRALTALIDGMFGEEA